MTLDSTLLLLQPFDAATPPERMREQLRRTGALYITGHLDRRAVRECRQLVLRALAAHGWIEEGTDPPIPRDPVHRIGSDAFTRCLESIMTHERLHEIGHGAPLVELAGALLGDGAFAHPRKMVRLAYPTHRSPLDFIPPHQDIVYVKGEPDTLTFWIPLGDVPPGRGGLRVWEGSHRAGLRPVAANNEGRFQCSAADLTDAGTVWRSADYRMGDVLVFHSLTVHGSGHNDSDAMRLSMDCRYSSADGVVNADQLLPAYHPALPGWERLGVGWSALDLTAVPASLTIEDADAPVADALARGSRFA